MYPGLAVNEKDVKMRYLHQRGIYGIHVIPQRFFTRGLELPYNMDIYHMTTIRTSVCAAFAVLFTISVMPLSASARVDYGAWYTTPAPYHQQYYQPMYAYAYAPAQSSQNTYINYPQQNYSYGQYPQQNSYSYGAPSYNYYPQQYSYPQYNTYPNYGYGGGYGGDNSYGHSYGPSGYGYPTGDTVPLIGGPLCEFPDYGRAACGSNPRQFVYDSWTGTWY